MEKCLKFLSRVRGKREDAKEVSSYFASLMEQQFPDRFSAPADGADGDSHAPDSTTPRRKRGRLSTGGSDEEGEQTRKKLSVYGKPSDASVSGLPVSAAQRVRVVPTLSPPVLKFTITIFLSPCIP